MRSWIGGLIVAVLLGVSGAAAQQRVLVLEGGTTCCSVHNTKLIVQSQEFAIPVNSSEKDDRNCEKRRLIFQEPSSLGNSFHFSDRKPALLQIRSVFFPGS